MIRQVAVIGTGTMGRGIAYLAATSGFDTVIYDTHFLPEEYARFPHYGYADMVSAQYRLVTEELGKLAR